jgi:primosomal protein DnaI
MIGWIGGNDMESIGDVLRQITPREVSNKAHNSFTQLVAHPVVQEWLAAHSDLDVAELKPHLNMLYQLVRDRTHCASCPGLDACPNDFPGHFTTLLAEKADRSWSIDERKQMCHLLKARNGQEALKARVRSFYIDERALSQRFSAEELLNADAERVPAVRQVIKYILATKEKGLQSQGLYLYGPFGTGKTYLLHYMLHELAKVGLSGAIVYMPDFVEDVKAMIQEPQRLKDTVEILKETDLLVFDDVGAENLSPWVRDHVFGAILNHRMERKPTFFTSNFELSNLQQHFSFTSREGDEQHKGLRLMERIRPFVEAIFVGGTNKRGR